MSVSKAKQALIDLMTLHQIVIEATFIPFSKSRNAKPKPKLSDRSLNWTITLKKADRIVYQSNYGAGIGHCPAYRQGRITLEIEEGIIFETEHGKQAKRGYSISGPLAGAPITPDTASVLSSLLSDGDAINYPTYDAWASELGYDVDSRKGEAIYRECLACGLALRAAFGDVLLAELAELAREL